MSIVTKLSGFSGARSVWLVVFQIETNDASGVFMILLLTLIGLVVLIRLAGSGIRMPNESQKNQQLKPVPIRIDEQKQRRR